MGKGNSGNAKLSGGTTYKVEREYYANGRGKVVVLTEQPTGRKYVYDARALRQVIEEDENDDALSEKTKQFFEFLGILPEVHKWVNI